MHKLYVSLVGKELMCKCEQVRVYTGVCMDDKHVSVSRVSRGFT